MSDNVHTALAKAQSEMGKAIKDSQNPHFRSKYADLASVMNACLPALTANGIAVTHSMDYGETMQTLATTMTHGASNTSVSIQIPILLGKRDMQGLGSAMTYARRYGVMALAGIAPEDDDGNAAAASGPAPSGPSQDAIEAACGALTNAADLAQLKAIWADLPKPVQRVAAVNAAKNTRKDVLETPGAPAADLAGDEIPY